MIIKKVSTTTPTQALVIDGNSVSKTDAYSANYVNQLLDRGSDFITVKGTDDTTYNMSSAWTYHHLNLNTVDKSKGYLLTFNNNHIVIGEGVSYVRISGLIGLWDFPNIALEIHPRKNDSSFETIYYTKQNNTSTECVVIPPMILPVQEGDTLDVAFTSGYTGNYKFLTRPAVSFFTVEVVYAASRAYNNNTSEWLQGTLTSQWRAYSNAEVNKPCYKKINNIVEIRGIVQPTSTITGSNTEHTIFTLPEGYRPSTARYYIMQGSANNEWLLSISTEGTVNFSRYRNGGNFQDASTNNWFPFNATFFVD